MTTLPPNMSQLIEPRPTQEFDGFSRENCEFLRDLVITSPIDNQKCILKYDSFSIFQIYKGGWIDETQIVEAPIENTEMIELISRKLDQEIITRTIEFDTVNTIIIDNGLKTMGVLPDQTNFENIFTVFMEGTWTLDPTFTYYNIPDVLEADGTITLKNGSYDDGLVTVKFSDQNTISTLLETSGVLNAYTQTQLEWLTLIRNKNIVNNILSDWYLIDSAGILSRVKTLENNAFTVNQFLDSVDLDTIKTAGSYDCVNCINAPSETDDVFLEVTPYNRQLTSVRQYAVNKNALTDAWERFYVEGNGWSVWAVVEPTTVSFDFGEFDILRR